jgi:hypothetical protein
MECRLAGETDVLGENLPQRHFGPSQYPTWPDPVLNPGHRGGKPATNRLSYGAAFPVTFLSAIETKNSNKQDVGYLLHFPCCWISANNPITNELLHAHVLLSRPLGASFFVTWFHYRAVSLEKFMSTNSFIPKVLTMLIYIRDCWVLDLVQHLMF